MGTLVSTNVGSQLSMALLWGKEGVIGFFRETEPIGYLSIYLSVCLCLSVCMFSGGNTVETNHQMSYL